MYVNDTKSGSTVSNKEPEIVNEKAGTAWVDGQNVLGKTIVVLKKKLSIRFSKYQYFCFQ